MTDLWRWQCRGAGCRACFEAEGAIGGATCPYCGATGIRIMRLPDFHDDKPDGRPDLHVETQPGDLDAFGRTLRPGT